MTVAKDIFPSQQWPAMQRNEFHVIFQWIWHFERHFFENIINFLLIYKNQLNWLSKTTSHGSEYPGRWTFSQNFSALALTVLDKQCLEDSIRKDHPLNQWMKINDKGVYRTAPATPGLLIMIYLWIWKERENFIPHSSK